MASFAAEREDRGRPPPFGNRTWAREAQTHKKQKLEAAARKQADAEAWARATNKATEDTQVYKQKKEEKKVLVETGTAIEKVGADILAKRQAEVAQNRESRRRRTESKSKSPSHSQSVSRSQEARATPSPSVTSVTSDISLTSPISPQSPGQDDEDNRVQHLSPRTPESPTIVTNVNVTTESTEAAAASPGDANPEIITDAKPRKGCCAACVVC